MKWILIFTAFICLFTFQNVSAKILDTTIFSYTNVIQDYKFHLSSFFTSGAPGACPKVQWTETYKSNDTIYIRALYDMRGVWPFMGCGASDYIFHTNTYSDVKYYTITSGYVKGPSATPEKDTLKNLYDTTFYIGTAGIKDQNAVKALTIYPNPTSTYISLPIAASELRIYNTYGQVVVQTNNVATQQPITVAQLSSGLYYLAVYDKERNKVGVGKFYKE